MGGILYRPEKYCLLSLALIYILTTPTGTAAMSPPSYRLGPNDTVKVQVYGEEDLAVESKIDGDGNINFPLLGVVHVAGKTLQELQEYLTTRLANGYIRTPKVTASVFKYRNFYVSGEVKTPGGYPYEEGLSIQKALATAGGLTEKAERGDLRILRSVNGHKETLVGTLESLVLPDDVIVVAKEQRFYISGEVKTPGRYPYEKGLTIHKVITMAGGFTDKASESRTRVLRVIDGQQQSIRVKLEDSVLPDDIIVVPRRFF